MEYSQEQLDAMVTVFSRGLEGADIAHMYNLLERVEHEHISTLEERLRKVLIEAITKREKAICDYLFAFFESLAEDESKGREGYGYECNMRLFFGDLEMFDITLQDAYYVHTQQFA